MEDTDSKQTKAALSAAMEAHLKALKAEGVTLGPKPRLTQETRDRIVSRREEGRTVQEILGELDGAASQATIYRVLREEKNHGEE